MEILNKKILDDAFLYCEKITREHYENFPVASLLIPYEKRPYIQCIYSFARIADDYADESNMPPEQRINLLNDWENKLKLCYQGKAEHPVFIALTETVSKLNVPIELFQNLITAFKMDVVKNRYKNFNELLDYCNYSANPVGRLVLLVFGYNDDRLFKLSDSICTALQLTNFYQDIKIDLLKNRVYLPEDEMLLNNYTYDELFKNVYNQNFINLMQLQVNRARSMFYDGVDLIGLVDKDLQLELKLVWLGGMSVLKKIKKYRYNVFDKNIRLNMINKVMIFLLGLFKNDLQSFQRKSIWDLN